MIVKTSRFGSLEVKEDQIITMENGLLGFPDERIYAVLDDDSYQPFQWLQSLTQESLAFVVVDPYVALKDYEIIVSPESLKRLGASHANDLSILVILTMSQNIQDITMNLRGPILVHKKRRCASQVVLSDESYSTRHTLFGDNLQVPKEEEMAQQPPQRRQQASG